MDFYKIEEKVDKRRRQEDAELIIFPNFEVCRTRDLMVRGGAFYAIWDEEAGIWSTNEYDVPRLVDAELRKYAEERAKSFLGTIDVRYLRSFSSKMWVDFKNYMKSLSDNSVQLDEKITFVNDKVKKSDHVSKRVPYFLERKPIPAYEELVSTLYEPEERTKIEWAIGSIFAGDSKKIQKFLVFYGEAGSGKSTMLNIIQKLFEGYYTTFEAKVLTGNNNQFATETFKSNPLVAIQHDGDLSKIEDNTKLNSIVSHEEMSISEKYKSAYTTKFNAFLFMGTNQPVKITDAKSGLLRRLIDISPSGNRIPAKKYQQIINQIDFELGGIAAHCLDLYLELGKDYYNDYRPVLMMQNTDIFFNFMEENYYEFKTANGVTLKRAYDMYKEYCDDALISYKLNKMKFKHEMMSYFEGFGDRGYLEGQRVRNYYYGFLTKKFSVESEEEEVKPLIVLEEQESIFDKECGDLKAQYALDNGAPTNKWEKVKTKLSSIDTKKLHYCLMDKNHIVIDFDLKNKDGNKSLEKNLDAASKWPLTYSEVSKSGEGLHLHYIFDGDSETLSRIYEEGIEIKVFTGNASLRRQLTKCNNLPIAHISSGLPLKGEKMVSFTATSNEKAVRTLIAKNLNKEYHPGTKPSVDFIFKILEDAYKSGINYDVTDLRPKILTFAMNSTNQAEACIKLVEKMQFKSEESSQAVEEYQSDELIFFDVEVFPNLFVVVWKKKDKSCVKMINPTPQEIEELLKFKLVGFNCRRYDNHILYARYIGYNNEQLFKLSQRIINNSANAMIGEAYNVSYTDIYDFSSAANKMSLKKHEIRLGIHHQELGIPWDKPVPEELWDTVADYCCNDVIATESTFDDLSGDWAARQILAELSGLSVNDTTNAHSTRIIFGTNKHPQNEFVYTDLSEMFPGYKFENGKSTYRGYDISEGGQVYSEPGIYGNVALLDIASMHPASIRALNLFGPYTKIFCDLLDARLAIKHKDRESLEKLLGGKLVPFYDKAIAGEFSLKDISNALKTVINSVYGLTSASFENPFRDPRNIDNIVAKRGALFMIDLKFAIEEKGFKVAHIKTDSVKIPDATPEIIEFIFEFGKKYGYDFEHEATYNKLCLLDKATYAAKDEDGNWTSTGATLIHPYVFKTLFSHEPIEFKDMCETKSVQTAIYLNMTDELEDPENYQFVGKVGSFCPMKNGGGILLREKDGKYHAVSGTKGYRWLEAEMVEKLNKQEDIDISYFEELTNKAFASIAKLGDAEWFVSDAPYSGVSIPPCEDDSTVACDECEYYVKSKDLEFGGHCKLGVEMLPFK